MATRNTVELLLNALAKVGIKNTYVQAGIVGVVGTESNYVPKTEKGYSNTPNDRIRLIFGSKLSKLSDQQLTALKANDQAFFQTVYGGQYGNNKLGDGFLYRGRGFNGITFKENYARYGKAIGVDLVSDPDKLNDPTIAAAANAVYFSDTFKTAAANGSLKKTVGIDTLAQVKDFETGVKVALQANAGFGKNTNTTFYKGVYQKALDQLDKVYDLLQTKSGKAVAISLAATLFFF